MTLPPEASGSIPSTRRVLTTIASSARLQRHACKQNTQGGVSGWEFEANLGYSNTVSKINKNERKN